MDIIFYLDQHKTSISIRERKKKTFENFRDGRLKSIFRIGGSIATKTVHFIHVTVPNPL